MKSQKNTKIEKSVVVRIPIDLHKKISKRGMGCFKTGLIKTDHTCELIENAPADIILNDVDAMMMHLKRYYPDIHHNHLHNLPAFTSKLLKTNEADYSMLTNGKEVKDAKPII